VPEKWPLEILNAHVMNSIVTQYKIFRHILITINIAVFFSTIVYCQAPTDNPYLARYPAVGTHWTNSINWANPIDITKEVGVISKSNHVDSSKLAALISRLSKSGGGVVYFPAGTYSFNFSLKLDSNVVIRGADPLKMQATNGGFRPPTRFEFPRYIPKFIDCGAPRDIIKCIYADTTGIVNSGLVNIDVNRATINFFPGGYRLKLTLQGRTYSPEYYHDNIVIIGVRQNNAAIPSPSIPTARQKEKGNCWQRWPYPFIANINLFVTNNCVVADCRLNDEVTDDFEQPGYVDDGYSVFSGKEAKFSYVDHPGICLNAHKIVMRGGQGAYSGPYGPYGIFSFTQQFPFSIFDSLDIQSEPSRAFEGLREIRDNFILTKQRHPPIIASMRKNNTLIENNLYEYDRDTVEFISSLGNYSNYNSVSSREMNFFSRWLFIKNRDTLSYRLMRPQNPKNGEKYPLIIYFHPDDQNGNNDSIHLNYFLPLFCKKDNFKKFPCYILAPKNKLPAGQGWIRDEDRSTFQKPLVMTKLLIDSLINTLSIDPDRIYAVGLSKGGTAAFKLATRYPEFISAVATLDGIEYEFTPREIKTLGNGTIGFWTAVPKKYGSLSLFLITRVNLIELKNAGNKNAIFKMIEKEDRESMLEYYYDDYYFISWLFSNRRKQNLVNTKSNK
jgi:Esterase PHB depolymerase